MDNDTTGIVPARTDGLEGDTADSIGSVTEPVRIEGAVSPDAARNADVDATGTDDFTASFSEPEPIPKQRKKWSRRSKNSPRQEGSEAPLNINGVEKILFSIHAGLAAITQVPEFVIEEKEAKELAAAIEGVTEQYKLTLDPKVAAYIDLARVVTVVYGPRAASYYFRKQAQAKQPRPAPVQRDNVTDIRSAAPFVTPARPVDAASAFDFDPTNQKPITGE